MFDKVLISHENVQISIDSILDKNADARVLIAGSVYLAGEVLETLSV